MRWFLWRQDTYSGIGERWAKDGSLILRLAVGESATGGKADDESSAALDCGQLHIS